METSSKE